MEIHLSCVMMMAIVMVNCREVMIVSRVVRIITTRGDIIVRIVIIGDQDAASIITGQLVFGVIDLV